MKEIEIQDNSTIPDHEIEALAQCFLPYIRDYYDSEEGQKAFEDWSQKTRKKR